MIGGAGDMSGMLLEEVRIENFRALQDVWVPLRRINVLIGENNAGKTSFLHALAFLFDAWKAGEEDIHRHLGEDADTRSLMVDALIRPDGAQQFPAVIKELLADAIQIGKGEEPDRVALRAHLAWDDQRGEYRVTRRFLRGWARTAAQARQSVVPLSRPLPTREQMELFSFHLLDAKRDIVSDLRMRGSYWSQLMRDPQLPEEVRRAVEQQIGSLNQEIIRQSPVLDHVTARLGEMELAAAKTTEGRVGIVPIPERVEELLPAMGINYAVPGAPLFPLGRHGMGTRSWAALLVFRAYAEWIRDKGPRAERVSLQMIGVEEPEAHLHPQAHRALFGRLQDSPGQKFISTHSPYVGAQASMEDLLIFRREAGIVAVRPLTKGISPDSLKKVQRFVQLGHADLLFARALILVSGQTEEVVLPIFFQSFFGTDLYGWGVSLVQVEGDRNFPAFVQAARAAGIPWFVLSDSDQSGEGAAAQLEQLDGGEVFRLPVGCNWEQFMVQAYPQEVEQELGGPGAVATDTRADSPDSKADMARILARHKLLHARNLAERIAVLPDPQRRVPEPVRRMFERIREALGTEVRAG